MNWKKVLTKGLEAIELLAQLGPSEKEKKGQMVHDIETTYDTAYFSGKMSYSMAEACKDESLCSAGLERKY